ncbi:MAG: DUF5050 domain-containing protein [Lachnospiraceae bacterium]|nr:DUF5050 domain-containing protein [Lachnospiraceae bacterium]
MTSKKKVVLITTIILVLLIALYIINDYQKRVPQNPEGTVGNTAGNLNNGGYFCESDGMVYFANAYDGGTLYCMNPDESEVKKLNRSEVSQLNAAGKYLYYYQKNSSSYPDFSFLIRTYGLYRTNKKGRDPVCLDKSDCGNVSLADNTLFYTKPVDGAQTLHLFAIGTDKKNAREVADYLVNPSSVSEGTIYYNGTESDHYLYAYDTLTGQESLIKEYNMWFPTLHGQSIYFLDLESDYELCRYNLYDDTMTVLTTDRVESFNLTAQYIYYQTIDTDTPALMRMGLDGSNPELVSEGVYRDINVTSQYVYFRSYAADMPMYHTPADGAVYVTTFDAASQAAMKELSK